MKRIIITALAIVLGICGIMFALNMRVSPPQPTSVTSKTVIKGGAHYTVIPASTLNANGGTARLQVGGSGDIFAAYAPTDDVTAWLHGQRYARLDIPTGTVAGQQRLLTAPSVKNVDSDPVLDPDNADLWVDQRTGTNSLSWAMELPNNMSVLIANDGKTAAPTNISLTWPVTPVIQDAPYTVIALLSIGGIVGLLLADVYIFPFAVKRLRRIKPRTVPAVAASLLLILGAGYIVQPQQAQAVEKTQASLTDTQATRILSRVASTVNTADKNLDPETLATRMAGPAYALRDTAYKLYKKDKKNGLPSAVPTGTDSVKLVLSESTTAWPRTLFAVVSSDAKNASPQALTLQQDTPRGMYQIINTVDLQPGAQLPTLPGSLDGATQLSGSATTQKLAPLDIAGAYEDVLRDANSDSADLFNLQKDPLYTGIGPSVKAALKKSLSQTASVTYSNPTAGNPSMDTVAYAATDGSSLVSVYIQEQYTTKPKMTGVSIKPTGKTLDLLGVKSTKTGVNAVYGYQLLFVDPGKTGNNKLQLLGYNGGLLSANVLPQADDSGAKQSSKNAKN